MTTIGTAVLQIIPSLLGVSEEIEKQLDGKVVEVAVAPKVDPAAAQKAGKDAGTAVAKSANDAASKTPIQPKVDKPAAEKAGKDAGDSITKGAKDAVRKGDIGKSVSDDVTTSVKKSSPGKDLAKIIVDGIADGAKGELQDGGLAEVIVDGLAEGIKQGIDSEGVGGQVVDSIAGAVKDGNLGGTIKDAVLPTIKTIGTEIRAGASEWAQGIGDSLRSGDIQGATSEISSTVQTATNTIATIGETFGLQLDGVRSFGADAGSIIGEVGNEVQGVVDTIGTLKGAAELAGVNMDSAFMLAAKGPGMVALTGTLATVVAALAYTMKYGDTVENPHTQTSGGTGQPQLPGAGLPDGSNLGNIPLPPGTQLPPGFELGPNGQLQKKGTPPPVVTPAPEQTTTLNPNRLPGTPLPPDMKLPPGFELGPDGTLRKKKASGGQITGPGGPTSDIIPIWASNGEFIVNAAATRKSLPWLEGINSGKMPSFADGGVVGGPDVLAATALAGTKYSQGARTDCSGMVARVIDRTLGMPEEGLMSTKTAAEWLAARGFIKGTGGPGQISVGWYDHGPNPNDGHMAMTLSDGRNAESGGSSGPFTIGGNAAGASSPKFDQHMFLPTLYGEGPAGSSAASAPDTSGGGGSSISSAVMSTTPVSSSAGGGGGGGTSLPASFSGLATAPLDAMTRLGASRDGPGHRDPMKHFPEAASAAVSGQIDSALGVFGINGSPAFLDAASTLLGGISVGGHDPSGVSDGSLFNGSNLFNFGGAAPLSATSTSGGTPPPDDAHGTRAGQTPGPGVTYNIQSRDTEDAFIKANRIQSERKAAKLSVY